MATDPVKRLLGTIDRPLAPRSQFGEALLDRLLSELEREPSLSDAAERGEAEPMSAPAVLRPPVTATPSPSGSARRTAPSSAGRRNRALAHLATAALLLLTLAAGYATVLLGRPGATDDRPAALPAPVNTAAPPAAAPIVDLLWESKGGPDYPLRFPHGLTVGPRGNLWVAAKDRFHIFAPDGTFLETWGTPGVAEGQFDFVHKKSGHAYGDAAFDGVGNLYVVDTGNHRVQKFGPDRAFLLAWGGEGTGDGQFLIPGGIAVDAAGDVYVVDGERADVQRFDGDGRLLAKIGSPGDEEGQLYIPSGVAIDGEGTVWVAEYGHSRVQRFAPDGRFLAAWGETGIAEGKLNWPSDLAVDGEGRVYVAEAGGHRVQVFEGDGRYVGLVGDTGRDPGEFANPSGIALDGSGRLYVSDQGGNDRVQAFRLLPPLLPPITRTP